MKNFAAIDFETANSHRSSVCSVGIVVVRNGKITTTAYKLIRPVPNYYSYFNTQIHGITAGDTANAQPFPEVWREIEPLIEGLPLVAHNSQFDEGCLKAAFSVYNMEYPCYRFSAPARRHAANWGASCPTTNCQPYPHISGTTLRNTTTPWPTPKHAHASR